jgi:hypothetical protein
MNPNFSFVFIDLTTSATPANMKPGPIMQQMISDITWGLAGAFAAAHGSVTLAMRTGTEADRQPGEIAVHFRDTITEAPGALAYHTVTGGIADVEVGVDLFDGLLTGGDPLSVGVDHELKELLRDAGANGWKDRQNSSGIMDAEEACDFVQNSYIAGPSGVLLSDFVLPSFFIPGAPGPWDAQGVMQNQYDVSHGYGITVSSPTGESQIGGTRSIHALLDAGTKIVRVVGSLTPRQAARKALASSRTSRRGTQHEHIAAVTR